MHSRTATSGVSTLSNLPPLLLLQGIPRKQVKVQAETLLGRVKLMEAAGVRTGSYSGGMRRRLSVAIALLGARPYLLKCEISALLPPSHPRRQRA